MTDAVGAIGSIYAGAPAATTTSVVAPANNAGGTFQAALQPANQQIFSNPRVVEDPTIGFITQYLSANGSQVVSQSPSAITVAYLRNGLEPDGTSKPSTTHSA